MIDLRCCLRTEEVYSYGLNYITELGSIYCSLIWRSYFNAYLKCGSLNFGSINFNDFSLIFFSNSFCFPTETDDLHGLYMKCLCQGLSNVLQDYRMALLEIEKDVIHDAHLPVSHITCRLQEVISEAHLSVSYISCKLQEVIYDTNLPLYVIR